MKVLLISANKVRAPFPRTGEWGGGDPFYRPRRGKD